MSGRWDHIEDPERRAMFEAVDRAPVRIWFCPLGHSHKAYDAPPGPTVVWDSEGVAHCLEPGCDQTSASPAVLGLRKIEPEPKEQQ